MKDVWIKLDIQGICLISNQEEIDFEMDLRPLMQWDGI